ncbi:hypothetical protein K0B96_02465 [Horticoccus luteus]|uniref:Tetratricopeptide repeat protein n=1 Tax=Horticoccus luteus TaxID=2862869 RepID=A0A8F9TUH2_9BACT|nr:hypothetical protein [Horticoccus luteus]QYM79499.1 hypothetical protein K0B96_02465 [Horticoccus luteus]
MKSTITSRARLPLIAGGLAVLLFTAGCQTYQQQTTQFTSATRSGSLATAITTINKQADSHQGSKDEIVWRLEQGLSLRTGALADAGEVAGLMPAPAPQNDPASKDAPILPPPPPPTPDEVRVYFLEQSIVAFDQAEARVNHYEEEAKVKVGSEVGAAFTNQANLPYRGRAYDKVMMNAYKAMDYLQLGKKDDARVELNRSLQRQRDAVADNEKRIAEAQNIAAQAKAGKVKTAEGKSAAYDTNKALNDAKTGPALQAALNESLAPMKPYGDYVNPYAVFWDGLFFVNLGENGSDWERARKSLERAAQIVPENPYLKQDLDLATHVAEGKAPENLTYVIFETGTGPARDQVQINIPTFLIGGGPAYVGAAFPKLKFNNDYIASLAVSGGDQTCSTSTIASMDSIVANDFKNEWPSVLTKTLVTTATKAITQAVVEKTANNRGGMWGGLAAKVLMSAINASTNVADTRTWTSLPKEFQYARITTPADRKLALNAGGVAHTVDLVPGSVNIVYVKSTSTTAPLLVSQFALR